MLRRVAHNFVAQLFGVLLLFADRLLVVGILLRAWGPQTYADWAVLLSTASLLSLGELGLNIYFGNIWQKAYADNNLQRFQRIVSVAFGCSLAMGCLLAIVAIILLLLVDLPRALSISTLSPVESIVVLVLLGIATLSRVVRGAISQIYRGRQEFARGVVIDQIFVASLIALTITGGFLGLTPVILAIIYLACDLLTGWGVMVGDLSRRWPDLAFRPRLPMQAELLEIFRHVKWFAVLHGVTVVWVQLPVVLLGYIGITGSYLVSFLILRTLANVSRQLATMLAVASGVEIAAVQHAGHTYDVAWRLRAVGKLLSVMAAALAVAVALYGEPFIALWTGQTTLYDRGIAAALFGSVLITAPAIPLLMFGLYGNAAKPLAIAGLVQLALGLLACALMARQHGALGAAVGLAIGEAVAQGVVLPAMASRQAGIEYLPYFLRCIATMALTALWCVGVGLILRLAIDPHSVHGLLVSGLCWGLIGLVPSLAAILPRGQRALILRRLWHQANKPTEIFKP